MDILQIMARLPHRYPMLLIDRILALAPGKGAVGLKNVSMDEPFFGPLSGSPGHARRPRSGGHGSGRSGVGLLPPRRRRLHHAPRERRASAVPSPDRAWRPDHYPGGRAPRKRTVRQSTGPDGAVAAEGVLAGPLPCSMVPFWFSMKLTILLTILLTIIMIWINIKMW